MGQDWAGGRRPDALGPGLGNEGVGPGLGNEGWRLRRCRPSLSAIGDCLERRAAVWGWLGWAWGGERAAGGGEASLRAAAAACGPWSVQVGCWSPGAGGSTPHTPATWVCSPLPSWGGRDRHCAATGTRRAWPYLRSRKFPGPVEPGCPQAGTPDHEGALWRMGQRVALRTEWALAMPSLLTCSHRSLSPARALGRGLQGCDLTYGEGRPGPGTLLWVETPGGPHASTVSFWARRAPWRRGRPAGPAGGGPHLPAARSGPRPAPRGRQLAPSVTALPCLPDPVSEAEAEAPGWPRASGGGRAWEAGLAWPPASAPGPAGGQASGRRPWGPGRGQGLALPLSHR